MARPSARENLRLWELVAAFGLVVAAGVLQTFHFFNNSWLIQRDSGDEYQRGLGDDCLKSEDLSDGIKCSTWSDSVSTFVKNGRNITAADVKPPATGLSVTRFLIIMTIFLYLAVVVLLFLACVKKKDLLVQKLLCGLTLLLIFLNVIAMLPVIISSFSKFLENKGECSLGSAFYFFFLSNILLIIGSAAHFDTWKDVYAALRSEQNATVAQDNQLHQEIHLMGEEERRPSFVTL